MILEPEKEIISYWQQENDDQLASLYEALNDNHLSVPRIKRLIADLADWEPYGDPEEAKAIYHKNEYIIGEISSHIEGGSQ